MKLSTSLATVMSLVSISTAAPTNALQHLDGRAENSCTSEGFGEPIAFAQDWVVVINTPVDNQPDGCGGGFLDNYRGRCGDVGFWGCDAIEPGVAIRMTFQTSIFCTDFDITEATKAASGGITVDCHPARRRRAVDAPAIEEKRTAVPVTALETRAVDSCVRSNEGDPSLASSWDITINTPVDNQPDGCGGGFLDNYRGRCGVITNWGCDAIEPGVAIAMSFDTSLFCTTEDIQEATKAASGGIALRCSDA